MRLTLLALYRFRNHAETSLECSPGLNLLLGNNGEGKTNVLEGISYLCLGRSFYSAADGTVTKVGTEGFLVKGTIASDGGVEYRVETSYESASGNKHTSIGGTQLGRRAELIGQFPVVVLSPENSSITFGGPAERRKFLDVTLSQASRTYLDDLLEYRKALRQRNKILFDAKQLRGLQPGLIEPWNELLAVRGARIALRRRQFVDEFRPYCSETFAALAGSDERPELSYQSSVIGESGMSLDDVVVEFQRVLAVEEREEIRTGKTLVGPHRDELELQINGLSLRQFASQGQHKTFLVGLKLAEFSYLKDRCKETPLLLLDDVFSELDEHRCEHLLGLVGSVAQVFITATDERLVPSSGARRRTEAKFIVRGGTVGRISQTTVDV